MLISPKDGSESTEAWVGTVAKVVGCLYLSQICDKPGGDRFDGSNVGVQIEFSRRCGVQK